ncbi:extracellular solute-binding protein [Brevibacillus humidisoli]|uniref:ABC transporter substrate-binding protein n=1 Tax=Brevibacillus humidisoli TaxID=2895522 RepID=UPI001E2D0721|nr:extracellular solute-binding protein [Brevibacillus humidisoli]UFJ41438.1 extracellular solute-binding protein [Brevibacillus humidisoli]
MKKLRFTSFMAMVMALSMFLAACGGESGNTGTSNGGDQAAGEQPKEEQVVLQMHSWRVEDKAGYEKIIKEFENENPGIKIEFKPFKATEYNTILNTALQSDSGPDIIQLRPYQSGMALADAGHLEPLDDVAGMKDFPQDVIAAATAKDGKIYGVPLSINSTQIFYNKKIFEENGIQEPKSWDELINVAKTLKEKGITPFAFGSKEGWLLSLTHGVIAPGAYNGNQFVDQIVKGETNFLSPEFLKSLERMNELVPYFPDNFTGLDGNDIRTLFFTEKAAMYIHGSFELEVLRQMNPDLQLDFFPMPTEDGKSVITTWVDGSWGVNAKSAHKEEAKKFMEFLASKKFGELFANEFKRISAVPGVSVDDPLVNKMAELSQSSSTPYLILVHFNEGNPTPKATIENTLQGMYLGERTPEQVAQEVQKAAETWFEPFKK